MRRYGKTGGNGARFDVGEKGRWRRDKKKKRKYFFFFPCDSFSVSLFFLPLKSETQSAEGQ